MNYESLKRMYNHILLNVEEKEFDISKYSNVKSGILRENDYEIKQEHICGSVGCIIGHCVKVDWENVKENFIEVIYNPVLNKKIVSILYESWSEDFLEIDSYSYSWCFLFSPSWSDYFASKKDALTRMRFVIETQDENELKILYRKFIDDFVTAEEFPYLITENPEGLYIPIEYHQHSPYEITE